MSIRAIWAGGGGPAPLWVANVGGYFASLGLDVECFQIPGSGNCVRAVLEGSAEMALIAAPAAIERHLRGADAVIVAGHYNTLLVTLNARPGIDSVAELKGKRLGMGVQGEVEEYILRAVLPLAGYTLADFEVVPRGEGASPWLTAGDKLDVLLLQPPQSLEAPRAGWRPLLDVVPLNFAFQLGCMVASRRWVEAHPDETLAIVRGYAEGLYRFVADQCLGVDVMGRWTSTSDPEALRATHELYAQRFELVPYPTLDGIAAILQTLVGTTPGAATARPEDFVDTRFVAQLEADGLFAELGRRYSLTGPRPAGD